MHKLFILFTVLTFKTFASVPKNDLYIPADIEASGGLTKTQFHNILNAVASLYPESGIVLYKMWDDGKVNAYAENVMGQRNVTFFGGMARYQNMSEDAYALIACHEYGHHLGGAPRKTGSISSWASSEGQSDYFAATKCIKRYFEIVPANYDISTIELPERIYTMCADDTVCLRGAYAGEQMTRVFSELEAMFGYPSETPSLSKKSPIIVEETNRDLYPTNQCRLDTVLQGLLCDVDPLSPVNGYFPKVGYCASANGDEIGLRPNCWFASQD